MDVENFKRLFLPLHPKLFRIAYALVENKADAEDILQDAYYKLWSRRNELTDIQNPEAFWSRTSASISFAHLGLTGATQMSPKPSLFLPLLHRTKSWKDKTKYSKSAT